MFEWDDDKNRKNIGKRGVSIAVASLIFNGRVLTWVDRRRDYGELREISIGMVGRITILTVVHTDRNGNTRLISARPASRAERKRYEKSL